MFSVSRSQHLSCFQKTRFRFTRPHLHSGLANPTPQTPPVNPPNKKLMWSYKKRVLVALGAVNCSLYLSKVSWRERESTAGVFSVRGQTRCSRLRQLLNRPSHASPKGDRDQSRQREPQGLVLDTVGHLCLERRWNKGEGHFLKEDEIKCNDQAHQVSGTCPDLHPVKHPECFWKYRPGFEYRLESRHLREKT